MFPLSAVVSSASSMQCVVIFTRLEVEANHRNDPLREASWTAAALCRFPQRYHTRSQATAYGRPRTLSTSFFTPLRKGPSAISYSPLAAAHSSRMSAQDFCLSGSRSKSSNHSHSLSPGWLTTTAGNNFTLSWTVPSTNFVLRQNPGLTQTNWSPVADAPVLNFTNLQNQVRLTPSNGNCFFRLATP